MDTITEGEVRYQEAVATFGLAWRSEGACAGSTDPRAFGQGQAPAAFAREHCTGCVVRETCLRFAVVSGEDYGVWGGVVTKRDRVAAVARLDR